MLKEKLEHHSDGRILLLTERIAGRGHLKAAENIAAAIQQQHSLHVPICYALEEVAPALAHLISYSYRMIINQTPQVWNWIHRWNRLRSFEKEGVWTRWLALRLEPVIQKHQPQLIGCTHAMSLGALAYLKQQAKYDFHLAAIFTDFQVHPYWVYPEVDSYYVPTPWQRQQLLQKLNRHGEYHGQIEVMGIPICPEYGRELSDDERAAVRAHYGLQPSSPTILCIGGGNGEKMLEELFRLAIRLSQQIEWLFVTGTNHRLYEWIQVQVRKMGVSHIHPLAYINKMNELMTIADAVVSKAGGLTSAEVLAQGLPFFIYKPLPGQEEANCHFLSQRLQIQVSYHLKELEQEIVGWLEQGIAKKRPKQSWGDAGVIANSLVETIRCQSIYPFMASKK
ncbi:MGDG synthase family glycosyltransferase [Rubeoparvulum massiliense]|uniref:MGDG synthase family glycosyltransferase n=1 Tax=Rubeoparvulum massiliense TaxID=1631346 RepID=UPI00065E14A9|nr:glycosyltransferase [Rubeoparvulum massiliense]